MHYKLISGENELLAICKIRLASLPDLRRNNRKIDKELRTEAWWWHRISQAEFETYQAFGITEVKL